MKLFFDAFLLYSSRVDYADGLKSASMVDNVYPRAYGGDDDDVEDELVVLDITED